MKKGSFLSISRTIASRITSSILIALFVLSDFAMMPLEAKAALPTGFATETIVSGLNYPTSMAFTPDARIFVAEKSGAVRVIKNGQLLPNPLVQLTDINTYADRGLIGIAVDPNFATNGYIYLSYTFENTPGANFTAAKTVRIVRLTVVGDTSNEGTKLVLVGAVGGNAVNPSCENYAMGTDCIASDSSSHSSGGLRFGPDGKLYATLGDGAMFDVIDSRALRAQNLDSLNGKMLRINTDGTAPADNPFYNGNPNSNRSKIYAYGLRNMFRFSFRPSTGALYGGDVGWDTWEEINVITAGANYGWPCREGNNATTYNCTATNYVNPTYSYVHSQTQGGSITAGVFPTGNVYPASYNNKMFFGDFALNTMSLMDMGASDVFGGVTELMTNTDGANGPVDYAVGPDGYIYFISIYTGDVRRFVYTLGNRQPVAQIAATPTSGSLPLSVQFSSAGSSDPDGNPLTYLWNFGDGSTSTAANPTHTYTVAGTYTATLRVSDGAGGLDIKSTTIFAGNRAPVPTITSPVGGELYFPGEVLTVTGSATDPDTGTIAGSALTWRAILHHNTHTHILETHTGNTFQFMAPDHGDPEVYTEIELAATDPSGTVAKTSVNIYLSNGVAPGSNLIQNPSFETADPTNPAIPLSWNSYKWGTSTATFTYPVAGYDGAAMRGAKVTVANYVSGDAKWGFDPVHVDANRDYTFSGRYQSTVPTRLVAASTNINDITTYTELATYPATATWAQTSAVYHTPADTRTLAIFHLIDQNGSLTVDTFSLTDGTVVTPPPPVLTNFILNPSLETAGTGALPENWQKNKWGTSTTTFTYPATAQDGAKGASITMTARTSGDAKWFFNDVNVTPGTQYTFSNYYQSNVITELVVRYTTSAGVISYVSLGNVPVSATWAQNTKTITPPVGAAKMTVLHVIKNNGNLFVDNYQLTDGSTTQPPTQLNLITNGFMETVNGANPLGWTPTSIGGITSNFTYPTVGVDGGKAAGIAITAYPSGADGNARWQFNEVPISQGIEYTYEGWYKGSTISDIIGRYTFADGSEHYFGLKKEIPAATNWTFVTGKFVGPVNVTSITLMHEISTVATMEIDNVTLYQSGTGTPNEITPPVAAFTTPTDGATISGTVTLTSNVTDNSGQAWIFYAVDGTPLGAEMPIPYTQQLDTTTLSNGPHSLKVTARDAVGNNSRQIINITVDNTTTPPPNTNLISNPSLETANGSNPASWLSNKWGTNTATFSYPVAGQDGASAASINMTARTSGDAKWFFNDVNVTPGTQYTFSNYYKATVQTQLVVRYTNASGVASYSTLATLPVAANWAQANTTFTPPAGTVSATMFHILYAVGTLTVDNYVLSDGSTTPPPPPPPPLLNLIQNPSLEDGTTSPLFWLQDFWGTNTRIFTYPVAGTDGAKAAKVEITAFTDGDAKWAFDHVAVTPGTPYTFSDKYQSNVATSVVAEYKLVNGTYDYQELGTVPASAAWASYQIPITVPVNVQTMTVFHLLGSVGFLSVDQMSLSAQ